MELNIHYPTIGYYLKEIFTCDLGMKIHLAGEEWTTDTIIMVPFDKNEANDKNDVVNITELVKSYNCPIEISEQTQRSVIKMSKELRSMANLSFIVSELLPGDWTTMSSCLHHSDLQNALDLIVCFLISRFINITERKLYEKATDAEIRNLSQRLNISYDLAKLKIVRRIEKFERTDCFLKLVSNFEGSGGIISGSVYAKVYILRRYFTEVKHISLQQDIIKVINILTDDYFIKLHSKLSTIPMIHLCKLKTFNFNSLTKMLYIDLIETLSLRFEEFDEEKTYLRELKVFKELIQAIAIVITDYEMHSDLYNEFEKNKRKREAETKINGLITDSMKILDIEKISSSKGAIRSVNRLQTLYSYIETLKFSFYFRSAEFRTKDLVNYGDVVEDLERILSKLNQFKNVLGHKVLTKHQILFKLKKTIYNVEHIVGDSNFEELLSFVRRAEATRNFSDLWSVALRLKGTIYEMVFAKQYGLRYETERLKPRLIDIVAHFFPDKLKQFLDRTVSEPGCRFIIPDFFATNIEPTELTPHNIDQIMIPDTDDRETPIDQHSVDHSLTLISENVPTHSKLRIEKEFKNIHEHTQDIFEILDKVYQKALNDKDIRLNIILKNNTDVIEPSRAQTGDHEVDEVEDKRDVTHKIIKEAKTNLIFFEVGLQTDAERKMLADYNKWEVALDTLDSLGIQYTLVVAVDQTRNPLRDWWLCEDYSSNILKVTNPLFNALCLSTPGDIQDQTISAISTQMYRSAIRSGNPIKPPCYKSDVENKFIYSIDNLFRRPSGTIIPNDIIRTAFVSFSQSVNLSEDGLKTVHEVLMENFASFSKNQMRSKTGFFELDKCSCYEFVLGWIYDEFTSMCRSQECNESKYIKKETMELVAQRAKFNIDKTNGKIKDEKVQEHINSINGLIQYCAVQSKNTHNCDYCSLIINRPQVPLNYKPLYLHRLPLDNDNKIIQNSPLSSMISKRSSADSSETTSILDCLVSSIIPGKSGKQKRYKREFEKLIIKIMIRDNLAGVKNSKGKLLINPTNKSLKYDRSSQFDTVVNNKGLRNKIHRDVSLQTKEKMNMEIKELCQTLSEKQSTIPIHLKELLKTINGFNLIDQSESYSVLGVSEMSKIIDSVGIQGSSMEVLKDMIEENSQKFNKDIKNNQLLQTDEKEIMKYLKDLKRELEIVHDPLFKSDCYLFKEVLTNAFLQVEDKVYREFPVYLKRLTEFFLNFNGFQNILLYSKVCSEFLIQCSEFTHSGIKVKRIPHTAFNLVVKTVSKKNSNMMCCILDLEFNKRTEPFFLNRRQAVLGQSYPYLFLMKYLQYIQNFKLFEMLTREITLEQINDINKQSLKCANQLIKNIINVFNSSFDDVLEEWITHKNRDIKPGKEGTESKFIIFTASFIATSFLIWTPVELLNSQVMNKMIQAVRYPYMLSLSIFGSPFEMGKKMSSPCRRLESLVCNLFLKGSCLHSISGVDHNLKEWVKTENFPETTLASLVCGGLNIPNGRTFTFDIYLCHIYNKEISDFDQGCIKVEDEMASRHVAWEKDVTSACNRIIETRKSYTNAKIQYKKEGVSKQKKYINARQSHQLAISEGKRDLRLLMGIPKIDPDKDMVDGKMYTICNRLKLNSNDRKSFEALNLSRFDSPSRSKSQSPIIEIARKDSKASLSEISSHLSLNILKQMEDKDDDEVSSSRSNSMTSSPRRHVRFTSSTSSEKSETFIDPLENVQSGLTTVTISDESNINLDSFLDFDSYLDTKWQSSNTYTPSKDSLLKDFNRIIDYQPTHTFGSFEMIQFVTEIAKQERLGNVLDSAIRSKRNWVPVSQICETTSIIREPVDKLDLTEAIKVLQTNFEKKLYKVVKRWLNTTPENESQRDRLKKDLEQLTALLSTSTGIINFAGKTIIKQAKKPKMQDFMRWQQVVEQSCYTVLFSGEANKIYYWIKTLRSDIRETLKKSNPKLNTDVKPFLFKDLKQNVIQILGFGMDAKWFQIFTGLKADQMVLKQISTIWYELFVICIEKLNGVIDFDSDFEEFVKTVSVLVLDYLKVKAMSEKHKKLNFSSEFVNLATRERNLLAKYNKMIMSFLNIILIMSLTHPIFLSFPIVQFEAVQELYAGIKFKGNPNTKLFKVLSIEDLIDRFMFYLHDKNMFVSDIELGSTITYLISLFSSSNPPISHKAYAKGSWISTDYESLMEKTSQVIIDATIQEKLTTDRYIDFLLTTNILKNGNFDLIKRTLDKRGEANIPRSIRSKVIFELINSSRETGSAILQEMCFRGINDYTNVSFYTLAPKDQLGGVRDLLIQDLPTKVNNATSELFAKSILEQTQIDGLTNLNLPTSILEVSNNSTNLSRKSDKQVITVSNIQGEEHVTISATFCISGDCTKWGPIHCCSFFSGMWQQLLRDHKEWKHFMMINMMKSLEKRIEIPVASVKKILLSFMNSDMYLESYNTTQLKDELVKHFRKFSERWKWSEYVVFLIKEYLSKGEMAMRVYNHMGQGIHHATSSLLTASFSYVFDTYFKKFFHVIDEAAIIKIDHAGSSDDFSKVITIESTCLKKNHELEKRRLNLNCLKVLNSMFALMRMSQMSISVKSVVSDTICEFYSSYDMGKGISPAVIKYISQQIICTTADSPWSIYISSFGAAQQAIAMSVPMISTFMCIIFKQQILYNHIETFIRAYGLLILDSLSAFGRLMVPMYSKLVSGGSMEDDLTHLIHGMSLIDTAIDEMIEDCLMGNNGNTDKRSKGSNVKSVKKSHKQNKSDVSGSSSISSSNKSIKSELTCSQNDSESHQSSSIKKLKRGIKVLNDSLDSGSYKSSDRSKIIGADSSLTELSEKIDVKLDSNSHISDVEQSTSEQESESLRFINSNCCPHIKQMYNKENNILYHTKKLTRLNKINKMKYEKGITQVPQNITFNKSEPSTDSESDIVKPNETMMDTDTLYISSASTSNAFNVISDESEDHEECPEYQEYLSTADIASFKTAIDESCHLSMMSDDTYATALSSSAGDSKRGSNELSGNRVIQIGSIKHLMQSGKLNLAKGILNTIFYSYYRKESVEGIERTLKSEYQVKDICLTEVPFSQILPETLKKYILKINDITSNIDNYNVSEYKDTRLCSRVSEKLIELNCMTEDKIAEQMRLMQALKSKGVLQGLSGSGRELSTPLIRQKMYAYHFFDKLGITENINWPIDRLNKSENIDVDLSGDYRFKTKYSYFIEVIIDMPIYTCDVDCNSCDEITNIKNDSLIAMDTKFYPIEVRNDTKVIIIHQKVLNKINDELFVINNEITSQTKQDLRQLENSTINGMNYCSSLSVYKTKLFEKNQTIKLRNNPAMVMAYILDPQMVLRMKPMNVNYSHLSNDQILLETSHPKVYNTLLRIKSNRIQNTTSTAELNIDLEDAANSDTDSLIASKYNNPVDSNTTKKLVNLLSNTSRLIERGGLKTTSMYILNSIKTKGWEDNLEPLIEYGLIEGMKIGISTDAGYKPTYSEMYFKILEVLALLIRLCKTEEDKLNMIVSFLQWIPDSSSDILYSNEICSMTDKESSIDWKSLKVPLYIKLSTELSSIKNPNERENLKLLIDYVSSSGNLAQKGSVKLTNIYSRFSGNLKDRGYIEYNSDKGCAIIVVMKGKLNISLNNENMLLLEEAIDNYLRQLGYDMSKISKEDLEGVYNKMLSVREISELESRVLFRAISFDSQSEEINFTISNFARPEDKAIFINRNLMVVRVFGDIDLVRSKFLIKCWDNYLGFQLERIVEDIDIPDSISQIGQIIKDLGGEKLSQRVYSDLNRKKLKVSVGGISLPLRTTIDGIRMAHIFLMHKRSDQLVRNAIDELLKNEKYRTLLRVEEAGSSVNTPDDTQNLNFDVSPPLDLTNIASSTLIRDVKDTIDPNYISEKFTQYFNDVKFTYEANFILKQLGLSQYTAIPVKTKGVKDVYWDISLNQKIDILDRSIGLLNLFKHFTNNTVYPIFYKSCLLNVDDVYTRIKNANMIIEHQSLTTEEIYLPLSILLATMLFEKKYKFESSLLKDTELVSIIGKVNLQPSFINKFSGETYLEFDKDSHKLELVIHPYIIEDEIYSIYESVKSNYKSALNRSSGRQAYYTINKKMKRDVTTALKLKLDKQERALNNLKLIAFLRENIRNIIQTGHNDPRFLFNLLSKFEMENKEYSDLDLYAKFTTNTYNTDSAVRILNEMVEGSQKTSSSIESKVYLFEIRYNITNLCIVNENIMPIILSFFEHGSLETPRTRSSILVAHEILDLLCVLGNKKREEVDSKIDTNFLFNEYSNLIQETKHILVRSKAKSDNDSSQSGEAFMNVKFDLEDVIMDEESKRIEIQNWLRGSAEDSGEMIEELVGEANFQQYKQERSNRSEQIAKYFEFDEDDSD
ncbi:MAG: RNA-dependent RNA polymerase [Hangzhou paederus fuscipes nairovirus 1]|nr:MAG: RNA-dependent RNA polymerase [Hangzhou paederus fuscipes nairovirus 1]